MIGSFKRLTSGRVRYLHGERQSLSKAHLAVEQRDRLGGGHTQTVKQLIDIRLQVRLNSRSNCCNSAHYKILQSDTRMIAHTGYAVKRQCDVSL